MSEGVSDAIECTTLWAARECVKEGKESTGKRKVGGSHGGKEGFRSGNLPYSTVLHTFPWISS